MILVDLSANTTCNYIFYTNLPAFMQTPILYKQIDLLEFQLPIFF